MNGGRTLSGRVTLYAALVVAIALVVLVAVFNLMLASSLHDDVDSRLAGRAAAARATVSIEDGKITTDEGPGDTLLDNGLWIFQGARVVEHPPATAALQRAARNLSRGPLTSADVVGDSFRLHAVPIRAGGRRLGTIVVATSLSAYQRTTRTALVGSIVFGLVMLLAMAAVMWFAVRSALRPVEEMTAQVAAWSSEQDLDERLGQTGRPDELERLAATFDLLLDRVAASLRHEQRLSAELSHELRTPLAGIVAEAELLARREPAAGEGGAGTILRGAQRMTRILDALMAAARAQARGTPGRCDAVEAAQRAVAAWHAHAGAGEPVQVLLEPASGPVAAGADAELTERMLGPLLENAARHATSAVRVSVSRAQGRARIEIRDDGPGVSAADAERVFEPGFSSASANGGGEDHDGAGLGLALARRLARTAGGDVVVIAGDAGGHFRVELPAA